MADFKSFAGTVAWDAATNTTPNGKTVKNFPISLVNSEGNTRVQVALWEEKADTDIQKGDFVLVEGSFTTDEYKGEAQYKVSAVRIVVLRPTGDSSPAKATETTKTVKKSEPKVKFG